MIIKSYITEKQDSQTRESIIMDRLAYLRWVLDNLEDTKEYVKIQNMYNALEDLTFDANGKLRSLKDLEAYIRQTMEDNKGTIPNLPTEEQIEEIDKKFKSLKDLHPDVVDKYEDKIKKSLIDKKSSKSDDQADQILNPSDEEDEDKLKKEIAKLNTTYGFTNILGLEPELKPSKSDEDLKKELKQAKKDSSLTSVDLEEEPEGGEEAPEDGEEAPKEEPIKEPTEEEPTEEESTEEDDEVTDKDAAAYLLTYCSAIAGEYMDEYGDDTDNIETFMNDKGYMDDLKSLMDTDEDEEIIKYMKNLIKKTTGKQTNESLITESSKEDTAEALSNVSAEDMHKKLLKYRTKYEKIKKDQRSGNAVLKNAVKSGKKIGAVGAAIGCFSTLLGGSFDNVLTGGVNGFVAGATASAVLDVSSNALHGAQEKKIDRQIAGLTVMAKEEKDPEKKKEYQNYLELYSKAAIGKTGTTKAGMSKIERYKHPEEYKKLDKFLKDNKKNLKTMGTEYIKENPKNWKDEAHKIAWNHLATKKEKENLINKQETKKQEEVVKDKDGSEIHARAKKTGHGTTYVRTKNGKEIGYATKDEFASAKKKSKNESWITGFLYQNME